MSRSMASTLAIAAFALLAAFAIIAIVTGEPGYILWSFVPLVLVGSYFVVAVRGESLGARKRERDEKMAERKRAARGMSASSPN
ncbi:hypothetical protein EK0264_03380 [Epidermidibacterium keratini]|uniref:Uncharacterized protein n=1 Tax=Epidermidibacterium keratini TaxID=1891644 RepID=A0A7L4YK38_9ACTN|nr:hypothetical protein [Epidermidibacterium keratini]QHB99417.1 hypothetical protein EK0264_03380 [Epidermidibacterium keratini]